MVDIRDYIEAMAVPEGMSYRSDCPVCGHNNSFSVSNEHNVLLYNCFYANCNISGKIQGMVNKPTQNPKQEIEFNLETATWIPVERSAKSMNYIRDNNIEHAYKSRFCNIQYDVKEDRCVFCIYKNSTIVDAVGRSLTGRKPKWKRYASSKLPFMTKNKSDLCVIVEDCASASAVTIAGHVGVALMGTNLLQEHIPHIVDNFKLAVVALDKDATQKSLDIAKELSVHMQTNIKFLDKDIKTWSKEKILTELS
jgi:hypothetical protein|tara:strand:+ start:466 stop:1221 length:756 start_codon:yes stop_codon:yes gene_type:complete